MAEASHHRLLQLPRSPNQLGCAGSLSSRDHRTLAPDTQPTQPKRRSHLGSNGEAGGRLAPKAANPSPLASTALRRQTLKVGAVCIKVHVRIRAGGAGQLALLPRPSKRLVPLGQFTPMATKPKAAATISTVSRTLAVSGSSSV